MSRMPKAIVAVRRSARDDALREVRRDGVEQPLDLRARGVLAALEEVRQREGGAQLGLAAAALGRVAEALEDVGLVARHPLDDGRIGDPLARDDDVDLAAHVGRALQRLQVADGPVLGHELGQVGLDLRLRLERPSRRWRPRARRARRGPDGRWPGAARRARRRRRARRTASAARLPASSSPAPRQAGASASSAAGRGGRGAAPRRRARPPRASARSRTRARCRPRAAARSRAPSARARARARAKPAAVAAAAVATVGAPRSAVRSTAASIPSPAASASWTRDCSWMA